MDKDLPTVQQAETEVLAKLGPDDRSELSSVIRKNLTNILLAMIESAKGMWLEKTVTKDGIEMSVPVYQVKPNTADAQYLLNQLMGRPKETQVSVDLQQNIIIQNQIKIENYDKSRAED